MYKGDVPSVRFFTRTGESDLWSNRGFLYLKALLDAGVHVRAIAVFPTFFHPWSRWYDIAERFGTKYSLPADYVNVICGPIGDAIERFEVGRTNIALTGLGPALPTISQWADLKTNFKHCFAMSGVDAVALRDDCPDFAYGEAIQFVEPGDFPQLLKKLCG